MNKTLIKVYKAEKGEIIEQECKIFGYPNFTEDGEQMFDNTHFKTRKEAINSGLSEAKAGVYVSDEMIKQVREKLINYIQEKNNHLADLESYEKLKIENER